MDAISIKPDSTVKDLAKKCFGYQGRTFKVRPSNDYTPQNYWDGGTRYECVAIQRDGLKIHRPSVDTANPFNFIAHQSFCIPPGVFIMERGYFQGKDTGITIYVRPDEMDTGMLPPSQELTEDEKTYLYYTRSLKTEYRIVTAMRETNITLERWEAAKKSCIDKKLANAKGAITIDGRNAILQYRRNIHV